MLMHSCCNIYFVMCEFEQKSFGSKFKLKRAWKICLKNKKEIPSLSLLFRPGPAPLGPRLPLPPLGLRPSRLPPPSSSHSATVAAAPTPPTFSLAPRSLWMCLSHATPPPLSFHPSPTRCPSCEQREPPPERHNPSQVVPANQATFTSILHAGELATFTSIPPVPRRSCGL